MSNIYSPARSKNDLILEQQNKLLILLTYGVEVQLLKSIPVNNVYNTLPFYYM